MIAFLLASLAEWRERHMRRTFCLSAVLLALVGLAGPLQPLLLSIAACLVFVVVAWAEGMNPPLMPSDRVDPQIFPASAIEVTAGKALSVLAVWLGLVLAISPILAASVAAWGIGAGTILSCLLCWLSAYLLASSIHFASKVLFDRTEGLAGLIAYAICVFWSFFDDSLKYANPFVQAWSIPRLEGGAAIRAFMWGELGAALAIFGCSALILARKKKRYRHE
jgi:hypothetical protein